MRDRTLLPGLVFAVAAQVAGGVTLGPERPLSDTLLAVTPSVYGPVVATSDAGFLVAWVHAIDGGTVRTFLPREFVRSRPARASR